MQKKPRERKMKRRIGYECKEKESRCSKMFFLKGSVNRDYSENHLPVRKIIPNEEEDFMKLVKTSSSHLNLFLYRLTYTCANKLISRQYLSPEESLSSTVLPMLDRRWSIFGTGCLFCWSSGVCRRNINRWMLADI